MAPGKLTLATLVITGPRAAALSGGGHAGHSGGTAGHGRRETYSLRYGLNRRMDVGLGYWSTPGKVRPSVNWQVASEQQARPGLLVGYGSEPMGEWRHDGAYVSAIKGFGPASRRTQVFAAYFREIDGGTNHLIAGVNQSLGARWSLFAGRYPFNSWQTAATYRLPSGAQLGLWAHDVGRKPRLGISIGVGWQVAGRARRGEVVPPVRDRPDEAKTPEPDETAALPTAPSTAVDGPAPTAEEAVSPASE